MPCCRFRVGRALVALSALVVAAIAAPGVAHSAVAPYGQAVLDTNPVAWLVARCGD